MSSQISEEVMPLRSPSPCFPRSPGDSAFTLYAYVMLTYTPGHAGAQRGLKHSPTGINI